MTLAIQNTGHLLASNKAAETWK